MSKNYKKSKFHFGELMRLLSVMEMNENKANHIKIYSKDTAVYFHAKYKFVPSIISFEAQRNLCKPVNALVQRYIERALKEPNPVKNHPFNWGMDMIFTKEKVQENKEFFNALYEKHGIDYKIK